MNESCHTYERVVTFGRVIESWRFCVFFWARRQHEGVVDSRFAISDCVGGYMCVLARVFVRMPVGASFVFPPASVHIADDMIYTKNTPTCSRASARAHAYTHAHTRTHSFTLAHTDQDLTTGNTSVHHSVDHHSVDHSVDGDHTTPSTSSHLFSPRAIHNHPHTPGGPGSSTSSHDPTSSTNKRDHNQHELEEQGKMQGHAYRRAPSTASKTEEVGRGMVGGKLTGREGGDRRGGVPGGRGGHDDTGARILGDAVWELVTTCWCNVSKVSPQ